MSDLNIGSATSTYTNYQTNVATKADAPAKESVAENTGVVYEKGADTTGKAPYSINKMSADDRKALVNQLKADQEARQSQLSNLVRDMLTGQAGVAKLADLFKPENLKNVTAEDIAKAKEDVSEDGYYGVKQTSQRLFDFAAALAGDDVDKMKEMQEAMMKGFKMAEKAWGEELPDISKKTIDAANQLFDDYYASKAN